MPADLYSDNEPAAPPAGPPPRGKPDEARGTATLPIEFFGPEPPEVGQRCEVEVLRVHTGSVEVRYVREGENEEEEPETPPGPPPGSPSRGQEMGGQPNLYE